MSGEHILIGPVREVLIDQNLNQYKTLIRSFAARTIQAVDLYSVNPSDNNRY